MHTSGGKTYKSNQQTLVKAFVLTNDEEGVHEVVTYTHVEYEFSLVTPNNA